MAPKMEPTSTQERLRAITEGVQKIDLKLGPQKCENGGPQGPPKISKKVKKSVKKGTQNRGLFQEGAPRGPRGAQETILERFLLFLGVQNVVKFDKDSLKHGAQKY